jgi:hypothetical protein
VTVTDTSPDVLRAIADLPHLKVLRISPSTLDNKNDYGRAQLPANFLASILCNCRLSELSLTKLDVADSDFCAVFAESQLRSLDVSGTNLSEEGLARLLTLPCLESFRFDDCSLTGCRLDGLPGSMTLLDISCVNAPVGTPFALFVARSLQLRVLLLSHSAVDDNFVASLGRHPNINTLWIADSRITDGSIDHLLRLPAIEFVNLGIGRISSEGADRLRSAKPTLQF